MPKAKASKASKASKAPNTKVLKSLTKVQDDMERVQDVVGRAEVDADNAKRAFLESESRRTGIPQGMLMSPERKHGGGRRHSLTPGSATRRKSQRISDINERKASKKSSKKSSRKGSNHGTTLLEELVDGTETDGTETEKKKRRINAAKKHLIITPKALKTFVANISTSPLTRQGRDSLNSLALSALQVVINELSQLRESKIGNTNTKENAPYRLQARAVYAAVNLVFVGELKKIVQEDIHTVFGESLKWPTVKNGRLTQKLKIGEVKEKYGIVMSTARISRRIKANLGVRSQIDKLSPYVCALVVQAILRDVITAVDRERPKTKQGKKKRITALMLRNAVASDQDYTSFVDRNTVWGGAGIKAAKIDDDLLKNKKKKRVKKSAAVSKKGSKKASKKGSKKGSKKPAKKAASKKKKASSKGSKKGSRKPSRKGSKK